MFKDSDPELGEFVETSRVASTQLGLPCNHGSTSCIECIESMAK